MILKIALFFLLGSASALSPLTIRDGKLQTYQGTEVKLKGVNWFGFNNAQTMVDGLWAGGTNAACDFGTILFQLRLLGFNAIRLPFTFSDLQKPVKDKKITCKVLTLEELYKRAKVKQRLRVPPLAHVTLKGQLCNSYLPNDVATIDRFIWVIEEAVRQGLYVIIDYHGMGGEDMSNFVGNWIMVWDKIMKRANYKIELEGRIIIDIKNEPDSMRLNWKQVSKHYIGVMDALYSLDLQQIKIFPLMYQISSILPFAHIPNSRLLFMVEGTGQTSWNLNWGDGFVSDDKMVSKHGISDASAFFDQLIRKPYRNNVIISPHIYGPSISKATRAYKGSDLFERLGYSFGYLFKKGYGGIKFPIVVGEFGTQFEDPKDLELYQDLSKWMKKNQIWSWIFWNYAENSGDTMDLVKNNFQDLNWKVIDWLYSTFWF
jgi:aryl-phospho-beta-D-glucosidase BglC (GH1 family)